MIPIQAKLWIGGIALVAISMSVWAGYEYVTGLQETVTVQAGEITKLEIENETLSAEREQLKTDLEDNKKNQVVLNEELRVAREAKDELIRLFADHDFAKLVQRKPGLIETRINKGTDKVFEQLESISDE